MKRFHFSLDTLFSLRKRAEDSVKHELATKNTEIVSAKTALQTTHDELKMLQESEKQNRQEHLNPQLLSQAVTFRKTLKNKIFTCVQKIDNLSEEAEAIRHRLVIARQKTRAVELVREKRFYAWKQEKNRAEQKFTDDIAEQGFIRGQKSAQAVM